MRLLVIQILLKIKHLYEYKNDCLIAGVKYNKSYYEDRDLKPSENLIFSITLTPLTSFEQKVDQ